MRDNPAINALVELANVPYPTHEGKRVIDPSHPVAQEWIAKTNSMTADVFKLMEEHRIPHHPKLKAQYDRGMLTGVEYAQATLSQLFGA